MNQQNMSEEVMPEIITTNETPTVRPWIRFFARTLDLVVLGLIVGLLFVFFMPSLVTFSNILNGIIILFLWFLIEPIFISNWGTTLGKCIFNIKITDINGKRPNLRQSYIRSFQVFLVGYGLGLPVISVIALWLSHRKLVKTKTTYWDNEKFIITHGKVSWIRCLIAILILGLDVAVIAWGTVSGNTSRQINSIVIQKELNSLNQGLPKKLDGETELTKIYMENNNFVYQYRLYNYTTDKIDKAKFYTAMRKSLIDGACADSDTKSTLSDGHAMSYNYMDKNDIPIENIVIHYSDCP